MLYLFGSVWYLDHVVWCVASGPNAQVKSCCLFLFCYSFGFGDCSFFDWRSDVFIVFPFCILFESFEPFSVVIDFLLISPFFDQACYLYFVFDHFFRCGSN